MLVPLVAACSGSGGGVDAATFEERLVARDGITEAQAGCVTGYVFAEYDPTEITLLYDVGLRALPSPRWAQYGHAMVGCLFHDPPDPPGRP